MFDMNQNPQICVFAPVSISKYSDSDMSLVVFSVEHTFSGSYVVSQVLNSVKDAVRSWLGTDEGKASMGPRCIIDWGEIADYLEHIPYPNGIVSVKVLNPYQGVHILDYDEDLTP